MNVEEQARLAKNACYQLAAMSSKGRDKALLSMALCLEAESDRVLEANARDLAQAEKTDMQESMRKRLALTGDKVKDMVRALRQMAESSDSLGEVIETFSRPNGLIIKKVRVPFGLVGIIYESRPNVTSDAAGLCIRSGNAVLLRGGKEARNSNLAIVRCLQKGLSFANLSPHVIGYVDSSDRKDASAMMTLSGLIDLLIPRGGPGLIRTVVRESTVPLIVTGEGNCHVYVDKDADLGKARSIVVNAKISNPAVCNAMETLLVHKSVAPRFLPQVAGELVSQGVEVRGCPESQALSEHVKPASPEDWEREYLDLVLAVKVVSGLDEALSHIEAYGTGHSEAVITQNAETARRFARRVDAAVVYVNASTRFTDGGEFGFGAEMGISTQKLHARGPMGANEMTTHKYVVKGAGHVR